MTSKNAKGPSKKRLFLSGIAVIIVLIIGMSYVILNDKEEQVQPQEITTFVTNSEIKVETEKALQLLSTQVNKGLDSIKNNNDEK